MLSKEDELFVHRRALRTPKASVIDRLRELKPWMWSKFDQQFGLTYHACRFCKRGGNDETCKCSKPNCAKLHGLWKYGVRHYICEGCRAEFLRRRPVRRVIAPKQVLPNGARWA